MSLIQDDFLEYHKKIQDNFVNFGTKIENALGLTEEKSSSPKHKKNFPIPLSKMEIKAFEGLCAMEGKSVKEKVSELVKDYIEDKKKRI